MSDLVIENNIVVGCKEPDILEVEIPEGIVAIGDNAFCNCKRLFSVTLPSSLEKIGESAFEGCSSLKEINLEDVSIIGNKAFCLCTALQNIKFGDKITYLCNATFLCCKTLEEIELPKNITYIGCECFRDCVGLNNITLNGVMEIDNNAFEHCEEIYSISLPETLLHIAPNAFSFCPNLRTVIIQNRFIDIDETAFEYNVNLIIKAVQYSTAYRYVAERKQNGLSFIPTILSADYRLVTSEEANILSRAGILFRMKILENNKGIIISFDKSVGDKIEQLIGPESED